MPAPQTRRKPHPRQGPSSPSCPGELGKASPVGETGRGEWFCLGGGLLSLPRPQRDGLKMSSEASKMEEGVCWVSELRNVQDPKPPSPPSSSRKCLELNPGGSHTQKHTACPRVHPAHSPPSPTPSSCSPPGPLCPCQTLHLSSHLWWEPVGKTPRFAQSITASQPPSPEEWGGSCRGSLGGGARVRLRHREGWAESGHSR